jgi:hypothetical protein
MKICTIMNFYNTTWNDINNMNGKGNYFGTIVFYISPDGNADNDRCLIVEKKKSGSYCHGVTTRSFPKGSSKPISGTNEYENFLETVARKLCDETNVQLDHLLAMDNIMATETIAEGDKAGNKYYLISKLKPEITIPLESYVKGEHTSKWLSMSQARTVGLARHRVNGMDRAYNKIKGAETTFTDLVPV